MTAVECVNILVVDDQLGNLLALETVLKCPSLNIVKATSGNEALAHLLEADFACVVLDVKMPEMDGFELAKIMRADARTKYVPIIFASGQQAQADVFRGYETGAVDYLLKPIDPTIVRSKINVFAELYRKELARVRAEKALEQKAAELTAANRELETFSYAVSHDLRAPLRAMGGFARILLEDYAMRLDDQGREHLNRVVDSAHKMGQLIDGLLSLSRFGRQVPARSAVDLSQMAQDIVHELKATQPDRMVHIRIAENVVAQGDQQLLHIAMTNLLTNAWKFTAKKNEARIEFGVSTKDGKNIYFVRDNGAGFDMAHIDRLFGPFQRLHAEDQFAGTGIGLATVRRIIERHGGRIWAEGEVERGATFYFSV